MQNQYFSTVIPAQARNTFERGVLFPASYSCCKLWIDRRWGSGAAVVMSANNEKDPKKNMQKFVVVGWILRRQQTEEVRVNY
jgi:hypothetical protein